MLGSPITPHNKARMNAAELDADLWLDRARDLCGHREALVDQLKSLGTQLQTANPDEAASLRPKSHALLRELREAACHVCEAAQQYRDACRNPDAPLAYKDEDYLAKMAHDLDFMGESEALVAAIGTPRRLLRNNPLMLPRPLRAAELDAGSSSETEVSSGAPWVKRAFDLNIKKKQNVGDVQDQLRAMGAVNSAADNLNLQDALPEPTDPALLGAVDHEMKHMYAWSQEGEDVVVTVQVPAETSKTDVRCDIKRQSMHLEVATLPEGSRIVVDGALELCFEVITDECSWSILKLSLIHI